MLEVLVACRSVGIHTELIESLEAVIDRNRKDFCQHSKQRVRLRTFQLLVQRYQTLPDLVFLFSQSILKNNSTLIEDCGTPPLSSPLVENAMTMLIDKFRAYFGACIEEGYSKEETLLFAEELHTTTPLQAVEGVLYCLVCDEMNENDLVMTRMLLSAAIESDALRNEEAITYVLCKMIVLMMSRDGKTRIVGACEWIHR